MPHPIQDTYKLGAEILVNTTTPGAQDTPAVTGLANGGFVITWTDMSQTGGDTSGATVRAQVFADDGSKVSGEILVPTTMTGAQTVPTVAPLADGRFIIGWQDASRGAGDNSGDAVRAQIFNADGSKSGNEFLLPVTTFSHQDQPALAGLPDGRFVAAWTDMSGNGDPSAPGIRAQIFNADGTRSGTEFLVNTTTQNDQDKPVVAAFADGHFVVAWNDFSNSGSGASSDVRAQIFNADGSRLGTEFLVNTTTASSQFDPAITMLAGDSFVISWTDASGSTGDSYAIRAQQFAPDGTKWGDEQLVNMPTQSIQTHASLATGLRGDFVAVWGDGSGADSSGWAVRSQVFRPSLAKLVPEHVVNTTTAGAQWNPVIASLHNGDLVVAWEDQSATGGDTSSTAIRAQILRLGTVPLITSDGGAPTAALSLAENTTAVTTVTATDPGAPSVTFSIAGGADAARFNIDAATGALSFAAAPDFEGPSDADHDNSYEVVVRATDDTTLYADQTITVHVADVNEAPAITSNGAGGAATVSIPENSKPVTTVTASDPDTGATVHYTISGGADASRFQIDGATGALSFVAAPDFEMPADADHDNSYQVVVRASDGSLFDDQALTVTVTDVAEQAPIAKYGAEFLANTTTFGHQLHPTFAGSPTGRFVAVWTDGSKTGGDTVLDAIRAQFFNADGTKLGAELLVNATTAGSQDNASVTALSDGRFVAAWVDYYNAETNGNESDIRAQLFNADGTRAGTEFVVSTATTHEIEPVIGALADGRFVVTWTTSDNISAQIFNADGTPADAAFRVNTTTQSWQADPAITVLANGGFVVTWTDASATGGDQSLLAVRAQIFDQDGAHVGGEFLVNTTTAESQSAPAVAALADGRFVAVWSDLSRTGGDTDHDAVRGQIFDADGARSGAEFLVNTTTAFDQDAAKVAALLDGRFVVAWQDTAPIDDQNSAFRETIRAQVFNADGSKLGSEFTLSTAADALQSAPTLAALADGRFVLGWEAQGTALGDTSGLAAHGQVFDERDAAVHLVGTPGDDDYIGTAFADTMRGGAGNDHLDGGAGDDTAIYALSHDQYTLHALAGGRIVVSGPEGTDVLDNFERIQFADVTVKVADVSEPPSDAPPEMVHLTGTPGADTFTALPGAERIDALGGVDTVILDFKLTEATVTYSGNEVIIDGPASHTVLTGFETYVFTDGVVNNNDGDPLVDDLFYYTHNHDVWNAHADADAHYHAFGWHEGRDPSAFFDTSIYLGLNPGVKGAGADPLIQFDQIGWHGGRLPSLAFDPQQYLNANPDVKAAGVDPLAHFLQNGASEGRQPFAPTELIAKDGFDYVYYLQHNPDVAAAGVDPLWHFETYGWKEGRNPNALFDVNGYLANYADVKAAGVNPLDHYDQFGWQEGRAPSTHFDTADYLDRYVDVAAAHVDPLTHFLTFGLHEGRSVSPGEWG
jgi:hypothetical protein